MYTGPDYGMVTYLGDFARFPQHIVKPSNFKYEFSKTRRRLRVLSEADARYFTGKDARFSKKLAKFYRYEEPIEAVLNEEGIVSEETGAHKDYVGRDNAEPTHLEDLKTDQLKQMCVDAGLPVWGKKQDIIDRLRENNIGSEETVPQEAIE